jgi:hypothetical protein
MASNGNCQLWLAVPTAATNLAMTNGMHSGRWLYQTQGNLLVSVPNQLYLANPVPFQVSAIPSGSTIRRDWPGGTQTYVNQWGNAESATILDMNVILPGGGYTWRIFDQSASILTVSPNFWYSIGAPALTSGSVQNTYSSGSTNGPGTGGNTINTIPSSRLPPYTLAPLWGNGYILNAGQQGIYYQVETIDNTTTPPRIYISIEWYFSQYTQDNNVFHAITTYDTGRTGVWNNYFFSAGATSGTFQDEGVRQTVGGQGSASSTTQYFQYCEAQACIFPGDRLQFNTAQNDMSMVANYSTQFFNPGTYPVGGWTYATRPRSTSS